MEKFIVIPRDAIDVLDNRFPTSEKAHSCAKRLAANDDQEFYVLQVISEVQQVPSPVKVTKL